MHLLPGFENQTTALINSVPSILTIMKGLTIIRTFRNMLQEQIHTPALPACSKLKVVKADLAASLLSVKLESKNVPQEVPNVF